MKRYKTKNVTNTSTSLNFTKSYTLDRRDNEGKLIKHSSTATTLENKIGYCKMSAETTVNERLH